MEFAKSHSNCAAEREFGVTEKMVLDWRSKENKMRTIETQSLKKMRTVLLPYDDLEEKLTEWVLDLRNNGLMVTRTNIRHRALQIAKERGQSDFKASAGWCTRYMQKNNLIFRQKTHIAPKLPKDVDCKVDSFLKYMIDLRKEYDFSIGDIRNKDDTPMFLDMVGNRTVNVTGKNTVNIKTTGSDKAHFTTILACLTEQN